MNVKKKVRFAISLDEDLGRWLRQIARFSRRTVSSFLNDEIAGRHRDWLNGKHWSPMPVPKKEKP